MIYIYPTGGLCNRLRAISGVIQLASMKYTKGGVTILWNQNSELQAPFNELFQPLQSIYRFNIKTYVLGKLKIKFPVFSNVKVTLVNIDSSFDSELEKIMTSVGVNHCFIVAEPSNIFLKTYLKNHGRGDYYIQTCHQHFGKEKYDLFIPQPNLAVRIAELQEKLGSNSIGVHIRRTDHTTAIENSPVSLFVKRMQEEIEKKSDCNFFISTDDLSVKKKLCDKFKDRIIVNNMKQTSRADLVGMKDAVIDLWALSKTNRILGSYWSSFSAAAASLGHIPLEIIQK